VATHAKLLLAGVLTFAGGFLVPFLVNVLFAILKLGGGGFRYEALTRLFTYGVLLSLCVGVPLILISIVVKFRSDARRAR
jgi:hypothetical protein